MYVSGKASTTRCVTDARLGDEGVVAAGLERRRRAASASSPTTCSPTLWRVPAYSLPGLPSPTTSQSNGVEPGCVRLSGDVASLRGGVAVGVGHAASAPSASSAACSSATASSAASISATSARIVSTVTTGDVGVADRR